MHVTVLGCRSGMPAQGEASSGYLVEVGGWRVLLDCGPGVATVLSGLGPAGLPDAVVISHLHADHCYDLLPLGKMLLAAAMPTGAPGPEPLSHVDTAAVPLYVPRGARPVLDRLAALFPVTTAPVLDRAFDLAFDVREYDPGATLRLGAVTGELVGLPHAAPSCGIRLTADGCTLAYTGDTGPGGALLDLARDADVLLAECTLADPDTGPHGHLCAADAGRAATRAGVGELVLTHWTSTDPVWLRRCVDRAAAEFDGPVHVARPRTVFGVGSRVAS